MSKLLEPAEGWQRSSKPRIAPASKKDNLLTRAVLLGIEKVGDLSAANLWLLLMNNSRLLPHFVNYAMKLMPGGELPRVDTELVILRIGWKLRCRYEWGQHVDIGVRAGVTRAQIHAVAAFGADGEISEGVQDEVLTTIQVLMLRAVDEFLASACVSDETTQALSEHLKPALLTELLLLIGWYQGLAGVLNTSGIELDEVLEKVVAEYTAV